MAATLDEMRERPPIIWGCSRCKVDMDDIRAGQVIVSPTGCAHHGTYDGMTHCGVDATGPKWWWPC